MVKRISIRLETLRRMRVRRLLGVIGLTLAMGGCEGVPPSLMQRPTAVLGGAIQVAGPLGYCADRGAGQQTADTAVVLMGRCRAALTVAPALITVSVGPAASAGAMAAGGTALTGYFLSEPGRAALSRDGRAGDVKVVAAVGVADAYLIHVVDRVAGEYWRAVLGVRGRLVTISANGAAGAPLDPSAGRKIVDATLVALRRANPAP